MGQPLSEYLRGDPTLHQHLGQSAPSNVLQLNRYLADDRILAFELVFKAGHKWHTRLISNAEAVTDVPMNTTDFINQRRRWLNGSFSATVYSLQRFYLLFKSSHNPIRFIALLVQMLYNLAALLLAWFSLAGFLLTIFVVSDIAGNPPEDAPVEGFPFGRATPIVNAVIQVTYFATVILQFIFALGSHAKTHALHYTVSFAIFAIVQLYLFMNLIYLSKRLIDFKADTNGGSSYNYINEYYTDVGPLTVLVTAVSLFGIYIAAGLLYFDPWHLLVSWAQYMFISSSYINILKTYAFSNIHDVSWGHKSGKKPAAAQIEVATKTNSETEAPIEQVDRIQGDIDIAFEQTVRRALSPYDREVAEDDDPQEKFMRFRTTLVAVYIFSNFLVCLIVMNDSIRSFSFLGDPYWHKIWFFRIWMWGNSSILMMQFLGCLVQRFTAMVGCCFARR